MQPSKVRRASPLSPGPHPSLAGPPLCGGLLPRRTQKQNGGTPMILTADTASKSRLDLPHSEGAAS